MEQMISLKPLAVSVVLGSFQRCSFLKLTLDSVRFELSEISHEIIVIDGGSTDGSIEWLSKQKDVLLILQHNRGQWKGEKVRRRSWGYFMNLGFKSAQGKYICMVSDDCLLVPGAIRNGVLKFEQALQNKRKIGAVAFYWRNWPEQSKYVVGLTWGGKMFVNHGLFLRSALEEVGFADEGRYNFYHADGDLCLRLNEAGYQCIDSSKSFVEHYSHANIAVRSTNFASQQCDWGVYKDRWLPIYGNSEQDWIEIEHMDVHNTASKFLTLWKVRIDLCKIKIFKIKSHLARFMKYCFVLFGF